MNGAFRVVIRIVFLIAFASFLLASLRHMAYFYHSFEPDSSDWIGPYALAVSIDVTVLILTVGVMFFRKGMSIIALVFIWLFILGLTAFSWLVNWEYAVQFQSNGLDKASAFLWINPILASAFAFLNVAYSIVAELFNSKPETAEDLQKKLDDLRATSEIKQELTTHKNKQVSTWISGKWQMLQDAFTSEPEPVTASEISSESSVQEPENSSENEVEIPEESSEKVSRKYTMKPEEASRYTGYAISSLEKQLREGKISIGKNGDYLVSSLKIKTGYTSEIPAVKPVKELAMNGHKSP